MIKYISKYQPTFIIVGLGVSGLVSARHCLKEGYNIIILEKNDNLGGVWYSKSYPNIQLQTTKYSYAFSDFPHFQKTDLYPTGNELMEYYKEYAKKHNILKYTRFNSFVKKTIFDFENEIWNVEYSDKYHDTHIIKGNYLIVCSGLYTNLSSSNLNINNKIKENKKIINPNRFSLNGDLNLNICKNKNIIIIGNGPTGCDLATNIVKYNPKSITILYRSKRWLFRRYLWNIISTHLCLSRFALCLALKLNKHLYIILVTISYYFVYIFGHNYFIYKKIQPPYESISRQNLVLNENIIENIYYKKIEYIQTNDIDITYDYISFNKKKLKYDLCIPALGYDQNIDFLNMKKIPYLYKYIIDPNTPNCAFIGLAASFNWIQMSELQIQWYLKYLQQKIKNIDKNKMLDYVSKEIKNKSNKEYDFHDLALSTYNYCDNLAEDLKMKSKYSKYNLKYWFSIPEHNSWKYS